MRYGTSEPTEEMLPQFSLTVIAKFLDAPPRLVKSLHYGYFRKLKESDSKLKKLSSDLDEEVADFLKNEDCL